MIEVELPDGSVLEFDDGTDTGTIKSVTEKAARQINARGFSGGKNPREMNKVMQFLGGAKHAWDRAAFGLKGLAFDLSPDDKKLLAQGRDFVKEASWAGDAGNIAGDVAITAAPGAAAYRGVRALGGLSKALQAAPVLGAASRTIVPAAVSGAAVGAVVNPENRGEGATMGAIGGVAGEGVARVLSKTLGGAMAGKVTPEAREMMEAGIDVPLWKAQPQGVTRNMAERVKAFPVVSTLMKGQEKKAIEQWNRNILNEALPPSPVFDEAGGVLRWEQRPIKETGQAGLRELRSRFDQAYDALYGGRSLPIDDVFNNELESIVVGATNYKPSIAEDVIGAVRKVRDIITPGTEAVETAAKTSSILGPDGRPIVTQAAESIPGRAAVTYEATKSAYRELDRMVDSAWRKGDADLAESYMALRDALDNLRTRNLPPEVQSMKPLINEPYALFKRIERAASSLGAAKNEGVFSPGQLMNASRALDKTGNKASFAQGRAVGQSQAQKAAEVLGSELPEVGPGTAEKLIGTGAFGLGMYMDPMFLSSLLLTTRQGQRFLQGGYKGQRIPREYADALANALRTGAVSAANSEE